MPQSPEYCPNCLELAVLKVGRGKLRCFKCKREYGKGHTARNKAHRDKTSQVKLTKKQIEYLRRHSDEIG